MDLSGEYFYSVAALFSCSAYLLGNILWLRILLVVASIIYIISGVSLGITSMVGWNSAYLAINVYHIVLLLLDRITISLPIETRKIYHHYFSIMSTREFRKIIMMNAFSSVNNEALINESQTTDKLFIILEGQVDIVSSKQYITSLRAGDLIGEMSFISKEPASASAMAKGKVECAFWTHDDLETLKVKNRSAYNKFISIIGCDLVRKLKRKNEAYNQQTTQLDFVL